MLFVQNQHDLVQKALGFSAWSFWGRFRFLDNGCKLKWIPACTTSCVHILSLNNPFACLSLSLSLFFSRRNCSVGLEITPPPPPAAPPLSWTSSTHSMEDPTGLSSEGAGGGVAEVDVCSLEIERKYDVIPAVICSMCCLFGIIYCFFGEGPRRLPDLDTLVRSKQSYVAGNISPQCFTYQQG